MHSLLDVGKLVLWLGQQKGYHILNIKL